MNQIEKEIDDTLNSLEEKIGLIILTGEFSKNKLFKEKMNKKYKEKYKILFLNEYEKNIMKGAALYGLYKELGNPQLLL